jgi:hypothetical protein
MWVIHLFARHLLLLLLCLVYFDSAQADTQSRPPIKGYPFGNKIYPSAGALGQGICVDSNPSAGYTFDHANTVPNSTYPAFPAVEIFCRVTNRSVIPPVSRVESFGIHSFGQYCPWSASGIPYNQQPNCNTPQDKTPKTCGSGNPINMATKEKTQLEKDYVAITVT